MISHKYKVIFIHIPKCAGSSIENFFGISPFNWKKCNRLHLTGWDPQHKIHLQHANVTDLLDKLLIKKEMWDAYYKFAFVRNPWDRAYSDYLWMMKDRKVKGSFEEYINAEGSFKTFLSVKHQPGTRADHLTPQHEFIYDKKGNLLVDYVGRFESLHHNFKFICQKNGIPFDSLPHRKKGLFKKKHYTEFFTSEQKNMVAEKYHRDIELFNYDF